MRVTRWLGILLLALLSACTLSSTPPTNEPLDAPTLGASGKPQVTISSPKNGDQTVVGKQILVTASVTDSVGVTRVQLLANNQIVKTVSSDSGQRNFQALLDYTPNNTGNVILQVVAYRNALASDPAQVQISVQNTPAQVTATIAQQPNVPVIDPNDPTCRALTNLGLNMRSGPGTSYTVITTLAGGTVVPIVGRTGDNSWWQVRYGNIVGWVSSAYTAEYGTCTFVPVTQPTAIPTQFIPPTAFPTAFPTQRPPTVTPGLPDLVITSVAGPTSVAIPGGSTQVTQTYSVTTTNTGGGPAGQFTNSITLPDGSTQDLGVVGGLGPGQSVVQNVSVTFTAAGKYTLQAFADSGSNITEVSEVNNSSLLNVTVTGP
jgi:uncharacterized protein YraI